MRFLRPNSAISLFDWWQDYSSVPTRLRKTAARSGGQGRPLGRRECASSLTAASTAALCRSIWLMLSVVATVAIATCMTIRESSCQPLSESSSSAAGHLDGFIAEASERFGIPAAWIRAIVHVELGRTVRTSSRKGGVGLSQLSPEKWTELRHRYALGTNPSDRRDNILAGTAHLREMYDRYGSKDFLAVYIMGPTRYDEHRKSGAPLPEETQAVVADLAPLIELGLKDVVGSTTRAKVISWRKAPLFVAQTGRSSSDKAIAAGVPAERSGKSQASVDGSAFAPRGDGLFARRGMEVRPQ